ncbi:hypothetical protein GQX74_005268 [Glossina fuscipes]|nr:hypothetical protein GQX74_005268 [Glossina fuscipes]
MYRMIQLCKTTKICSHQWIMENKFSAHWQKYEGNPGPICGDAKRSYKIWSKTRPLCSLPAWSVDKCLSSYMLSRCHFSRLAEEIRKSKLPKPKRHLHGALSMMKGKQIKYSRHPTRCCPKTAFYMSCRRSTKSSAIKSACPAPCYSEYARWTGDNKNCSQCNYEPIPEQCDTKTHLAIKDRFKQLQLW